MVAGMSVGVVEEFLIADPDTGRTVAAADEVLGAAATLRPAAPDAEVRAGPFDTQVEAVTGPCATLPALAARLTHGRQQLATAARAVGTWLVPSGTSVVGGRNGRCAADGRVARIADRYAGVARDQSCGCRVRIGVPDEDTAVAVVNHLRPWLPTLLALSANSPFYDGIDTGYASWRAVQWSRFPGAGVPPWFESAAEYHTQVERLVEHGVLVDDTMSFWLARPVPQPAVELRVADTGIDVDATLLQAALSMALVRTALDGGRAAPAVGQQAAAAATWSAARYGLTGPGVHPLLERQVPATVLLTELLNRVRPALAETGDLSLVESAIRRTLRIGTGAQRQRAVTPAEPFEVVRMLAASTVPTAAADDR